MSNYSGNTLNDQDGNSPWVKIMTLVRDGATVLDVGCSSGNLGAELISLKKAKVVGLDLNVQDVTQAKKRLTAAYVRNIERDDISDLGTFDHIIFADVIEHLVDPAETLKKIKPLLNKGGSVIFSIPNMANMGARLMILAGNVQYGETGLFDKTHLHYYDQKEVNRVFNAARYKITDIGWSERMIPEATLRKELKQLGLEPNKKFIELSRGVEATAYEFIGAASPDSKAVTAEPLPFASPFVMSTEERLQAMTASQDAALRSLQAEYDASIHRVQSEIERVRSSLSWRVTAPLRKAKATLNRISEKPKGHE